MLDDNTQDMKQMVAQARVELATPASSGQRSTDELQGHGGIETGKNEGLWQISSAVAPQSEGGSYRATRLSIAKKKMISTRLPTSAKEILTGFPNIRRLESCLFPVAFIRKLLLLQPR